MAKNTCWLAFSGGFCQTDFMVALRKVFFFIPASLDHLCLILAEGEEKKILVGSEAKEWKLKFNLVHLY